MRVPSFDLERFDVEIFANAGGELAGQWSLSELERLCSSTDVPVSVPSVDTVAWQLEGHVRSIRDGEKEIWLKVIAEATVPMTCQRCLQLMPVALLVSNDLQFVAGEEAAANLDAECENDVLVLSRSLNAKALIEDELLLALPLVPRHECCPRPLVQVADQSPEGNPPHPFAALAQWKPRGNF